MGLRCPQRRYFETVKGYPAVQTIGDHVKKRRFDLGLKEKEVPDASASGRLLWVPIGGEIHPFF